MNDKQKALILRENEKARSHRNADVHMVWRDGRLVDVQVTTIVGREEVKATNE